MTIINKYQIEETNDDISLLTEQTQVYSIRKKSGFIDSHFSQATAKKFRMFGFFFQRIILEIVLPLVLYFKLKKQVGELWATIISSIPGLLSTLFTIFIKRGFEPMPIIIIISFFIDFTLSLKYNNPKLRHLGGSIISGGIGITCLFSLILKKPLVYYSARSWATKNDPTKLAEYDEKWKIPAFRKVMINISLIWGLGLILQAIGRLSLIFVVSLDLLMILNPIITYVSMGLLTLISICYGMRKKKQVESLIILNQNQVITDTNDNNA